MITPLTKNRVRFKNDLVWKNQSLFIKKGAVKEITNVELRSDGLVTIELEDLESVSFPVNAEYLEDEKPISAERILNWNA